MAELATKNSTGRRGLALTAVASALWLAGCSSLQPQPLAPQAVVVRAAGDRAAMFQEQVPISGPIGLEEAVARALKYNLDLRLKRMESAVNKDLHEASQYDLLPSIVAGAGYSRRDNYAGGASRQLDASGGPGSRPDYAAPAGSSYSTSAELGHRLASVEFSWNLLDFGVGYYRAKQRADEYLIANERRRRVVQTTVHDVRYAYWRAVAAQRLAAEAERVMEQARQAIEQSRAAEARGAIPVQTALAYQRSLVDAVALLNTRRQELDFAKAELAALMSAPNTQFTLKEREEEALQPLPDNLAQLEDLALTSRPELREEDYRKRITADETRRQLMQAFPNLSLGLGSQYDSNRLLYNNDWLEGSVRASWNLLRLFSAPAVKKAGERQAEVDDARRQALSMAILTQTRVAALRYALAKSDLDLAQKSLEVDDRIEGVARSGVTTRAETELELVRTRARAMVSKYQRSIAYASAQAAYARVQHSVGQTFDFGDIDNSPLDALAQRVAQAFAQASQELVLPGQAELASRPKVRLQLDPERSAQGLLDSMRQALDRAGFEVTAADTPDAMGLEVGFRLGQPVSGLRRGEITFRQLGRANSAQYQSSLPLAPRESVLLALGEAAVTANLTNLREWAKASARPRATDGK